MEALLSDAEMWHLAYVSWECHLACTSYHCKPPYSYKQNSIMLVVNQFKCFIVPLSFNLSSEKPLRNKRGMKIPTSEYSSKVHKD